MSDLNIRTMEGKAVEVLSCIAGCECFTHFIYSVTLYEFLTQVHAEIIKTLNCNLIKSS